MSSKDAPQGNAGQVSESASKKVWPIVTIAAPLLNEASRLAILLADIEAQAYPSDRLQILLIDGGSDDGMTQMARQAAEHKDSVELMVNHKRLAAAALNLALTQAQGQYFMRIDARSRPAADYITRAIQCLDEEECAGVAGVQIAIGETKAGRVHALALNHLLGGGGARYRSTKQRRESETLYLGFYSSEWLRRVGGWSEEFAANEDYELNTRIRQYGGRLLVDPDIHIAYVARDTLMGLARQYIQYGAWRTVTWKRHHRSMRLRHLAPAIFAACLMVGVGLLPWSIGPLVAVLAPYALTILGVSLYLSFKHHLGYLPRLMVVFPTLHLSWGIAFWLAWLSPPHKAHKAMR